MSRPPGAALTGRAAVVVNTVRAGYGLVQLVHPTWIDRPLLGHPVDARAAGVARVLGARHLGQALATGRSPSRPVLALGAEVDLLHAASMIALGVMDRARRRAAFVDALLAGSFALGSAWAAHTADRPYHPSGPVQTLRELWADRLASVLVPRAQKAAVSFRD